MFLKIYGCFWLTIVLVISTQLALDRTNEADRFAGMQRLMVPTLLMYGQAAVAVHSGNHDHSNIRALAGQLESSTHLTGVYILDRSGMELGGKQLPDRIMQTVRQVRQNSRMQFVHDQDAGMLAVPFTGVDGKQYVVAGAAPYPGFHPPPPLRGGKQLFLRIAFVLLTSGIVCYLLARYLTMPLLVLSDATKRFAAGELSIRTGGRIGKRKDETTGLARDFDAMAERIESLVKLQRQLIGDISHELRSPLARLNVALDLAREKTGPDAHAALCRIEEEAQELNSMIGELLTLTRLESDIRNNIVFEQVDITELVREIVDNGNFEAQGNNRSVMLCEELPCAMQGNEELLHRAIENVVRNAIHYTEENSVVEVRIRLDGALPDNIRITVRDHGPGVPDSNLSAIFQPFFRVSESRERLTGGTGLGLAITERAVKLHNGAIIAENADGGGLLVTICLPVVGNICRAVLSMQLIPG